MAANLTLQYYKAEKTYRTARTGVERLIALEEMLRVIPKHKGTDHLQAALRAKIKDAKAAIEHERKSSKVHRSWKIPRAGCATAVLVGPPNSGKSSVLAALTNAKPAIADYPYSTVEPLAGILDVEQVQIQLIDTPPIFAEHIEPYIVDFIRTADLVLLCWNCGSETAVADCLTVLNELEKRKTRLDCISELDESDLSIVHVQTLLVMRGGTQADAARSQKELLKRTSIDFEWILCDIGTPGDNSALAQRVLQNLNVVRVYTKRPSQPVEMSNPYIMQEGETVLDLAAKIHGELATSFKSAKVWRTAFPDGQLVGRDYVLEDCDVVELNG